ncbi:hypothetical protein [Vibrio sp. 16]|uniref:hypothetical protein n=1 Tax=Vibrio sp. 16 TaxID=391586 RepID=UPI00030B6C94|nr:hypothetical protein [Vibrio sp. 16]CAK4076535.1 hypothetical protein PVDT1_21 [Vibrio sp. 16]
MKRVICQQVPSLTDAELEMVVGGKGYDGCKSKPKKLHEAMTGKGNKPKDKDWSGGCNSRG